MSDDHDHDTLVAEGKCSDCGLGLDIHDVTADGEYLHPLHDFNNVPLSLQGRICQQ